MLPARLNAGHLPYASTYDHRTVVLWQGLLANYSLGARNRPRWTLDVGLRRSIKCICGHWPPLSFCRVQRLALASLIADIGVLCKGEKRMVLATDTSKDALRCYLVWMLFCLKVVL